MMQALRNIKSRTALNREGHLLIYIYIKICGKDKGYIEGKIQIKSAKKILRNRKTLSIPQNRWLKMHTFPKKFVSFKYWAKTKIKKKSRMPFMKPP
jgi:hypothetical protein